MQMIVRNLPGGKYCNSSMKQLHESVNAEYGTIVKFPAIFGRPSMVITYDANDFEMVNKSYVIGLDYLLMFYISSDSTKRRNLARKNCIRFINVLQNDATGYLQ